MGWLRLVGDLIAGGRPDLGDAPHPATRTTTRWADGWPFFRIASVLGTGFLPHRATTLGLPGPRGGRPARRRPASTGARPASCSPGVLAALLAPFQFYAFPATYLIVAAVRR